MQTSIVLEQLLNDAPPDRISVGWIVDRLKGRSFGFVMLVLAIAGLVPGFASVSGFLLAVPALQMLMGREALVLPGFLCRRSASAASFEKWVHRLVPIFAAIERVIRPGKTDHVRMFTRVIGAIDFALALAIIVPVPFAYIPPTLAVILISFAQIEASLILLVLAFAVAAAATLFVAGISLTVLKIGLALTGL